MYALLLACGVFLTATHFPDMARSLLDPSPGMWWHVLLAMIVMNVCPAFFCDVSSSWRLSRGARAVVALAGVTVNAGLASLAALAAAIDLVGQSEFWWRLVLANLITLALNLVPFLKLDGYLLLLAVVDEPFVRPRAMADARSWLGRHIWRRSPQPRQFHRRWSIPYGLMAMLCPALLVTCVLLALAPLLFNFGWPGAVIWTLAVLLALARLADGILRVARPGPRPHPSPQNDE